jgi:hypothetical protein
LVSYGLVLLEIEVKDRRYNEWGDFAFPKLLATLKLLKNNPHIFSPEDISMLVSRELDLTK